MQPSFGDNVRIRSTEETEAAGFAGLNGKVYGFTIPSVTGVELIGSSPDDAGINVFFEERDLAVWFAPQLIEVVDHGAGTELRLEGIDKRWIRTADGGWREESVAEGRRPWWKFW